MTVFKGNNDNKMGVFSEQTCSRLRKCSFTAFSFLYNENHAIVAWFKRG